MASPRRNARTVVVTTFVLTTLAVPLAADARPPEHAPAHGQSSAQGPSRRPADATPPHHAASHGRASSQGTGNRTTASASTGDAATADTQGKGRARGHEHAPGQARKASDPARKPEAAAGSQQPAGRAKGPSTDARADGERPGSPAPRQRPDETAAAPAPGTGVEAVTTAPELQPTTPAAQPVSEPVTQGRPVWRLDVDGPFADLLEGVRSTIDRVVPQDLGPVREPLIRLVPVLLAILGAFLALQRGIGRGLGHVPMVASPALYDPTRRD